MEGRHPYQAQLNTACRSVALAGPTSYRCRRHDHDFEGAPSALLCTRNGDSVLRGTLTVHRIGLGLGNDPETCSSGSFLAGVGGNAHDVLDTENGQESNGA
ncbi:hypothetical protein RRG08_019572 [Elysia crispata]|uniref:Uncharacterized protein n=1 Tax=Elysia crispata TaxID=231223 RepID=A0AAE0YQU5_9GAST|nr:hypothetical protein RRG08_019572 [Elysia crispata]